MAQKYVTLEEAADRLGISVERMKELREQGQTHGYRDGASWKFKAEEVDRLVAEGVAKSDPGSSELNLDLHEDTSAGSDSLLLSELELGESGTASTSKVIGGSDEPDATGGESSDLELAADSGLELDLASSVDLDLDSPGSDVQLASGSSDLLSGEEGGSEVLDAGPGSQFENLDELDIDLEVESSKIMSGDDTFESPEPGGPASAAGSELSLDEPDAPAEADEAPSGGSEVDLAADEDLILGEGSGSDITLSSEDSGISLLGPSDSGLSLDDPDLDLGGSEVESLKLNMGDEPESAGAEAIEQAEEPAAPAAELESGEDFLLTPMEEAPDEESDDSGSQVIALDSEADLDENAVTQLGSMPEAIAAAVAQPAATAESASAPVMLEEDLSEIDEAAATPATAEAPLAMAPAAAAEPAYSGWVIVSLMSTVLVLGLIMMMMFDLVRNMWSWSESYTLKSGLMDWFLSIFG